MAACRRTLPLLALALVLPALALGGRDAGGFVGAVIYTRGGQVVAEVAGGVAERERLVVVGTDLRVKGAARVGRPLTPGTCVLEPVGSTSLAVGDRLTRETEAGAAARVFAENDSASYREFLALYPKSDYRARVGRELFRLAMTAGFPAEGGPVVHGRLRLAETVSREVSLAGVTILLDRFALPVTDAGGAFRLQGIPALEEPAAVQVRIRDPRFAAAEPVEVSLPAGAGGLVEVELPVRVAPTALVGRVEDARGHALPGAEVWTVPATVEALTDDQGNYRISRRKLLAAAGEGPADEPLFGGDFEVYARHKGFGVERVTATAESYRDNPVPALRLPEQDARQEELPGLAVDLRRHLWVSTPLR